MAPRKTKTPVGIPLSRELILEVALAIVESASLDDLTMRKLASELGVSPTAIYWHMRSRDEILQGLYDLATSRVQVPAHVVGPWEQRAKALCHEIRHMLLSYPYMFNLARQFPARGSARVVGAMIEIMRYAGFDDEAAVAVANLLTVYASGFAFVEANGILPSVGKDQPPMLERYGEWFEEGGEDVVALLPYLVRVDFDPLFEQGLDHLIVGLSEQLKETTRDP